MNAALLMQSLSPARAPSLSLLRSAQLGEKYCDVKEDGITRIIIVLDTYDYTELEKLEKNHFANTVMSNDLQTSYLKKRIINEKLNLYKFTSLFPQELFLRLKNV